MQQIIGLKDIRIQNGMLQKKVLIQDREVEHTGHVVKDDRYEEWRDVGTLDGATPDTSQTNEPVTRTEGREDLESTLGQYHVGGGKYDIPAGNYLWNGQALHLDSNIEVSGGKKKVKVVLDDLVD